MLTPRLADRLRGEVSALVARTVAQSCDFVPAGALARAAEAVEAFFPLYDERPVTDNKGGSGFNDSLWLFVLGRVLAPELIIESGTFKGHTSWLFRQACPDAEIHTFDVEPGNLRYRDATITAHAGDWATADLPAIAGRRALIFFDDHINQALRLRQAYERGFRWLLFDDNFPVTTLYATGGPPVPTLAMLLDPDLDFDTDIRWERNGKRYAYRYTRTDAHDAAALIDRYFVVPDLAPITRHAAQSGLTVVTLVE